MTKSGLCDVGTNQECSVPIATIIVLVVSANLLPLTIFMLFLNTMRNENELCRAVARKQFRGSRFAILSARHNCYTFFAWVFGLCCLADWGSGNLGPSN